MKQATYFLLSGLITDETNSLSVEPLVEIHGEKAASVLEYRMNELANAQRELDALYSAQPATHAPMKTEPLISTPPSAGVQRRPVTKEEFEEAKRSLLRRVHTLETQLDRSKRLIEWLGEEAKRSHTGISFIWRPACEGEPAGFVFMRRHCIGDAAKTMEQAIYSVMVTQMGEEAANQYLNTPKP